MSCTFLYDLFIAGSGVLVSVCVCVCLDFFTILGNMLAFKKEK